MKKFALYALLIPVWVCQPVQPQPVQAESVTESINRRLGIDLNAITIGEGMKPRQDFAMQKQAPQLQMEKQAFQAPSKLELQAPAKLAVVRRAHVCTLIPGRARRIARREDRIARQSAALELRLSGRTLLENPGPGVAPGRTVMENGACASCNLTTTVPAAASRIATPSRPARESDFAPNVPIMLTSLTTRELLEGGQINRQIRTVNEPGICGGGGNGGGRRGLFRRG